jgi:hypothetical protein
MSDEMMQTPDVSPADTAPASVEPSSEAHSESSFDKSFDAAYTKAEGRQPNGRFAARVPGEPSEPSEPKGILRSAVFDKTPVEKQYRKPPEFKPEAPPSEAPELEAQEQEQQASDIPPPVSLNKAAREHWAKLPREMQEYIAGRETQAQQKITELGQRAQAAKQVDEVFEHYRETAPKFADGRAAPPAHVMHYLLAANDALERNPAEALAYLARHYGVEMGPPANTEELRAQARQEAFAEAHQQMQHHYQMQQEQQMRATEQQLIQHVDRFASERAEQWPQIEQDVLYHIAAIRSVSPELSPQETLSRAYDKALAGRPDLDSTKKAETKKRADEAKRLASLNVKSNSSVAARSGGKWTDTMSAVYDRLHPQRF